MIVLYALFIHSLFKFDILMVTGIPRHLDPQDSYLRREAKQMKRENSPPRGPTSLSDPMKSREAMVPTVKEAGRSIHLIPREELRQTAKEGVITPVYISLKCNQVLCKRYLVFLFQYLIECSC